MESTLDLSRWRERPKGLPYRLRTIIAAGLHREMRTRLFRVLLFSAWMGGAAIAVLGFFFSQAMVSGGWLENLILHLGARGRATFSIISGFLALYPDVGIGGFFRLVFWVHSSLGLTLSLVALTATVPRLLTRDRITNALTLYLSRPLTSTDYLLGKFGVIVGVLFLMWTGPLLGGWLLSVAFAPDRDFIFYGFEALKRALLFNAIALASLAFIALGVSAMTRNARQTSLIWIALWLILGGMADFKGSSEWARRLSFSHNLYEVRRGVFELNEVFQAFAGNLPLLSKSTAGQLVKIGEDHRSKEMPAALGSLGVMALLASVVLFRKLRCE